MQNNKILSGFNYLSILFAPFIFPLIVWALTNKCTENHYHAGRALKLHLLPTLLTLIVFIVIGGVGALTNSHGATVGTAMPLLIVVAIVDVVLGIYNIYYGIKVMIGPEQN